MVTLLCSAYLVLTTIFNLIKKCFKDFLPAKVATICGDFLFSDIIVSKSLYCDLRGLIDDCLLSNLRHDISYLIISIIFLIDLFVGLAY